MKTFLIVTLALTFSMICFGQAVVSYESITITGPPAVSIDPVTLALVSADGSCSGRLEGGQIRFRVDGSEPTGVEGVLLEVGDIITIKMLGNLTQFKAIRTGDDSGILKIHCFQ